MSVTYAYDANGNVREIASTYQPIGSTTIPSTTYWYAYDDMNRFVVDMGTLTSGVIGAGATGQAITYNQDGERETVTNGSDGTTETYTYTADGYLAAMTDSNGESSQDVRDAMGRLLTHSEFSGSTNVYSEVETYDADSEVLTDETSWEDSSSNLWVSNATNTYTTGGAWMDGDIVNTSFGGYRVDVILSALDESQAKTL